MSDYEGCPEGMYPLDVYYDTTVYDTFEELRIAAEESSDILNLPLSWYFNEADPENGEPRAGFQLVFHMPRKGANWSMTTYDFDREIVQEWLDSWVRIQINKWFGWVG